MDELPGNSLTGAQKPKDDKPSTEKMIVGEATIRKPSLAKKFRNTFIQGDARSVREDVLWNVIIPATKDLLFKAGQEAMSGLLFNSTGPKGRAAATVVSQYGKTAYHKMSQAAKEEPRVISKRARAAHDFDEIVLESRAEAESILERLYELVNSQYGHATVADFYSLVGITERGYPDQKYGWTDLNGSGVIPIQAGYLIKLPQPVVID